MALYGGHLYVESSGGPLPCQVAGLLDASDAATVHFTGDVPDRGDVRIMVPGIDEVQTRESGGGDYTVIEQDYPQEIEYSSVAGEDLVGFCVSASHGLWVDLNSLWVVE